MKLERRETMKVSVGISNRHVHLTEDDFKILFGNDAIMEIDRPVNQPGQYASKQRVTIQTTKNKYENVRILGPARSYTQVEISKTDAYFLGVNPPVRTSGDLTGASPVKIIGPKGEIDREAAIIADRHIHIDHETRVTLGLENVQEVSVRIVGEKGGILDHVMLKESNPAYYEMHLDTDDANAHLLKNNDEVEIIIR